MRLSTEGQMNQKQILVFAASMIAVGMGTTRPAAAFDAHKSARVTASYAAGKPGTAQKPGKDRAKNEKQAVKEDIKGDKRDLKQDKAELDRLRADLKAAEAAGDRARIARDRDAIRRLEADMAGDRADIRQDKAEGKAGKKRHKGK